MPRHERALNRALAAVRDHALTRSLARDLAAPSVSLVSFGHSVTLALSSS